MNMRPVSLIGIWLSGILGAAVLGIAANAINSQVSPLYFRNVMHWHDVSNITRAIIAQGIFEGLLCGLGLSTIFAVVVGIVSKVSCPLSLGVRYVGYLLLLALACYAAGGVLAVLLAALSAEFYSRAFVGVPEETAARLRYAWVGGSIWGVQFGGAAAVLVISVIFRAAWRSREDSASLDAIRTTHA